jgi:hypothetical protein
VAIGLMQFLFFLLVYLCGMAVFELLLYVLNLRYDIFRPSDDIYLRIAILALWPPIFTFLLIAAFRHKRNGYSIFPLRPAFSGNEYTDSIVDSEGIVSHFDESGFTVDFTSTVDVGVGPYIASSPLPNAIEEPIGVAMDIPDASGMVPISLGTAPSGSEPILPPEGGSSLYRWGLSLEEAIRVFREFGYVVGRIDSTNEEEEKKEVIKYDPIVRDSRGRPRRVIDV